MKIQQNFSFRELKQTFWHLKAIKKRLRPRLHLLQIQRIRNWKRKPQNVIDSSFIFNAFSCITNKLVSTRESFVVSFFRGAFSRASKKCNFYYFVIFISSCVKTLNPWFAFQRKNVNSSRLTENLARNVFLFFPRLKAPFSGKR